MTSIRVAALCFTVVFAVSCAQGGASVTSPSALSAPAAGAAGPSAEYDASGRWHFVQTSPNPNLEDTWDGDVIQDPITGNLTVQDPEGNEVVLERLSKGGGAIITYRAAGVSDEGGLCDLRIMGTARLDTTTNTITLPIRFKELGCENERAGALVIGTKLS